MANSSQSGNILGYASGTQPGLVSTTAQTFAGDKTLTGLITASGGVLNTGLTSANATTAYTSGSGKVGEYRYANPASNIAISTSSTNLTSLTLPTGIWSISGTAIANPTSANNNACYAYISTVSGTYDSASFISSGNFNSSNNNVYLTTLNRIVNITAATQQFWLGVSVATAAPTGNWVTTSIIQAIRIA